MSLSDRHHERLRLPCCAVVLVALPLSGCSTIRLSEPRQTATEQLLISTAIDNVVAQLAPEIPPGSKVFVDPQFVDTTPPDAALYPKYAIGAIRDQLLRQGALLVDDKKAADVVVEPRSGAQSINHKNFLIGIPNFPIPIPLVGTVSFPDIALYKRDRQTGVAKLAITAYNQKTGKLTASTGPKAGASDRTQFVVLLFFSWTETDTVPKELQTRTK